AALGRLDLLRCARDNGCHMDEGTCRSAALKGHLEVDRSAPRGGQLSNDSLKGRSPPPPPPYSPFHGHAQVLQWARANGAPWNSETCTDAVRGGHLHIL
ncbi:unnamed protein product, partial [Hapterophycus canaliculatus]